MFNKFFGIGNETPEEILLMLQANADSVEEGKYFKQATDDEIREANDTYIKNGIKLRALEDKKEKWMTDHKAEVKPIALAHKEALQMSTSKGNVVEGKLFNIIDRLNGTVGVYNEQGLLINTRMAYSTELAQTNIIGQIRTGTNDDRAPL